MKKQIITAMLAVLFMQASYAASVKVLNSSGVEGTQIVFKGKNIDSGSNPVSIRVANENNVIYDSLEIVSSTPTQVVANLPYVSALRYLIFHYSGGKISEDDAEQIPVLVFDSPAVLDVEDGDVNQVASSSITFVGPTGPAGPTGVTGATGATGTSGASILGTSNTFTSTNTFSAAVSFTANNSLVGDNTINGATLFTDATTFNTALPLAFEGVTDNAIETFFAITDPTVSDKTITFPNATGTVVLNGSAIAFTAANTFAGSSTFNGAVVLDDAASLVFEGSTDNAFETTISITDPTSDQTITVPNANGTLMLNKTGLSLTAVINGDTAAYALPSNATTGYNSVAAPSDDAGTVTTLTGGTAGQIVLLSFNNGDAAVVTVDDTDTGAANTINLSGANTDFVSDDAADQLILMSTGTYWIEIGRGDN